MILPLEKKSCTDLRVITLQRQAEKEHKTRKETVKDIRNNKNDKESVVSAKPKQNLVKIARHYQPKIHE